LASANTASACKGTPSWFKPRDHFPDAILAHELEAGHFGQQLLVVQIKAITEQMQFVALEFRRQFCAGNEFDARRPAGDFHAGAAFHGVMVGQGHRRQAQSLAMRGQFLRRVSAVGKTGVKMKVGEH
jgi:hypothetical protein